MIIEKANAKINLSLRVLSKRDDGYHNILSLMASLKLHDVLIFKDIELIPGGDVDITMSASGEYSDVISDLPIEKNLITKAALKYFQHSSNGIRMSVEIEKNIPAGAGLGGGSSDAAAMLRVLNEKFAYYSEDELILLGAEVGADVPFCIFGGVCICSGIGEVIERVDVNLPQRVILVNDGVHVNTAEAYADIDENSDVDVEKFEIIHEKSQLISALTNEMLDENNICFINDFEKTVFKKYKSVAQMRENLSKVGSDLARMTGSGSTVFALFSDLERASSVYSKIKDRYSMVIHTEFSC